ncbi:MAG: putative circularly permuted ATP-grasp superfamily protein, partial [Loktanella salsilacus]
MNTKPDHFDEMRMGDDQVRPPYANYKSWFDGQDPGRLAKKSKEAEAFFRRTGITF